MRKMKCFVVVVSICLFFNACSPTESWNVINIDGYGSIQVPKCWKDLSVGEFMYIYSEKNDKKTNVLVQYRVGENVNQCFADIENMILLHDENFSNSACIAKYHIDHQDGSSEELFALYFTGPDDYKSTVFLCVDISVAEDTLRAIAKSYAMFK